MKRDPKWLQAVGGRLEAARMVLQLDHIDMAKAAGTSAQAWSNYVRAERPLDIEKAIKLCDRYKLTLDWIFRGDPSGLPYELGEKLVPRGGSVVPLSKHRKR